MPERMASRLNEVGLVSYHGYHCTRSERIIPQPCRRVPGWRFAMSVWQLRMYRSQGGGSMRCDRDGYPWAEEDVLMMPLGLVNLVCFFFTGTGTDCGRCFYVTGCLNWSILLYVLELESVFYPSDLTVGVIQWSELVERDHGGRSWCFADFVFWSLCRRDLQSVKNTLVVLIWSGNRAVNLDL